MKIARLQVLIGFFLTVAIIVTYKVISPELLDPSLKQARIAYEAEKLQVEREQLKRLDAFENERVRVKRATLQRDNDLNFYGVLGLFSAFGMAVLILASGYSLAKLKRSSVHFARIGQHSEIPIHQKDLQNFYPIAVNLSLAEIEASTSMAHDKAYRISRQMVDDITEYTRAIAGKRGMLALGAGHAEENFIDIPVHTATPSFAELLRNGLLAPGKPLILGYNRQGQPQTRSLRDVKSLAIAGWQGSGKTLSMGYIIASSVLAYGVQVYVVDPHKHHPESLSALIMPLEATGRVTIINPFDTPALIHDLHTLLDQRLNGQAPCEPGILLVIDEMARLAKMDCFDQLVTFLERCTEETRKANITFIGGSHKWTARHFKGRADIRGCMNSMLIHKTKPSQADLLVEDAHDKNLVKQLHHPGDAILVTDYDTPQVITMPLATRDDMQRVAELVIQTKQARTAKTSTHSPEVSDLNIHPSTEEEERSPIPASRRVPADTPRPRAKPGIPEPRKYQETAPSSKGLPDVIPFDLHFKKKHAPNRQGMSGSKPLTVEMLREQFSRLKVHDPSLTQKELAARAGVSAKYVSELFRGKRPLDEPDAQMIFRMLLAQDAVETPAAQY